LHLPATPFLRFCVLLIFYLPVPACRSARLTAFWFYCTTPFLHHRYLPAFTYHRSCRFVLPLPLPFRISATFPACLPHLHLLTFVRISATTSVRFVTLPLHAVLPARLRHLPFLRFCTRFCSPPRSAPPFLPFYLHLLPYRFYRFCRFLHRCRSPLHRSFPCRILAFLRSTVRSLPLPFFGLPGLQFLPHCVLRLVYLRFLPYLPFLDFSRLLDLPAGSGFLPAVTAPFCHRSACLQFATACNAVIPRSAFWMPFTCLPATRLGFVLRCYLPAWLPAATALPGSALGPACRSVLPPHLPHCRSADSLVLHLYRFYTCTAWFAVGSAAPAILPFSAADSRSATAVLPFCTCCCRRRFCCAVSAAWTYGFAVSRLAGFRFAVPLLLPACLPPALRLLVPATACLRLVLPGFSAIYRSALRSPFAFYHLPFLLPAFLPPPLFVHHTTWVRYLDHLPPACCWMPACTAADAPAAVFCLRFCHLPWITCLRSAFVLFTSSFADSAAVSTCLRFVSAILPFVLHTYLLCVLFCSAAPFWIFTATVFCVSTR